MTRAPIPTAADLGLMRGSPPGDDALVTLANWQDPPFNRWGFQHVRDLIPTMDRLLAWFEGEYDGTGRGLCEPGNHPQHGGLP